MWKKVLAPLLLGASMMMVTSCGDQHWQEGKTYGQWQLAFNGHGTVFGNDDEVTMEPLAASAPEKTHACLVHTTKRFGNSVDFDITVRTEAQVRKGEPNPWEVGWVLWNYEGNERFYALVLKPNGWELSKQDPAYPGNQRFLASGHEPTFAVGEDHQVRIIHEGHTMRFFANGQQLGEFTDEERPYEGGSIALYTEDARVTFRDFTVH